METMRKPTGLLKTCSQVWVVCPTSEYLLLWSDLLVYSYLAHQDTFGKKPNEGKIAWGTGLKPDTVKLSLERLEASGLYQDDRPMSKDGWFYQINEPRQQHWYLNLQRWVCLVRSDAVAADCRLSVPEVMVYSYLFHKYLSQWEPRGGWSCAYLAKCLAMDARTVGAALIRLEEAGLFRQPWSVAVAWVGQQTEFFKRKGEYREKPRLSGFVPENPPLIDDLPGRREDEERKQRCIPIEEQSPGWQDAFRRLVEYATDHNAPNGFLGKMADRLIVKDRLADDWKEVVDEELAQSG